MDFILFVILALLLAAAVKRLVPICLSIAFLPVLAAALVCDLMVRIVVWAPVFALKGLTAVIRPLSPSPRTTA